MSAMHVFPTTPSRNCAFSRGMSILNLFRAGVRGLPVRIGVE